MLSPQLRERADLHLHTTFSEGSYSPEQIVDLAVRSGLKAIAITDHDTLAGISPAVKAVAGRLEVVSGIELTAEFRGKEFHLLGYFFDLDNPTLLETLQEMQTWRCNRVKEMVLRLQQFGIVLPSHLVDKVLAGYSPGRRHLAEILVETRQVGTISEAFQRYLGDNGPVSLPTKGLPVARAISVIRQAGGVAVWAHPAYDFKRKNLVELKDIGLQGVEVEYPNVMPGRIKQMRQMAAELGLLISGGSDCHGPGSFHQTVGARTITIEELELLRQASRQR